jgi:polyhydroxybutyrate depolymerase
MKPICVCVGVFLFGAMACAPNDGASTATGGSHGGGSGGAPSGGSNGTPTGSGGAMSTGGQIGTGGAAPGSGGATGAGPGGVTGSGGKSTGSGGAGIGGSIGGAGGKGGALGAAGASAAGGASGGGAGAGGASSAVPSAGCGKAGRPTGGVVTVANEHIYNFPTTYDGNKPMPLVIAMHGAGNPNTQLQGLTNGTRLETNFVRAFPKSVGSGWVIGTDGPRVTTMLNDLLQNYCVDTGRVFMTGHSSGAQMVVQMLCVSGGEKRFKAVAPVAASKYCAKVSPIPVMYIQGMMDMMRGDSNGIDVVNVFTSSNMCGTTSVADTAVPTCSSTLDHQTVTPGCVTYQGCGQPTVWCSHNDNGYNTTDGNMHGWPCFASNAMADFFMGLP